MEAGDLIHIGKLKINSKKGELCFIPQSEYKHLSDELDNVFLIFKDYRVRYGKIDISQNLTAKIFDDDVLQELQSEESVTVGLDQEELEKLDSNSEYFDPTGMKVLWNDTEVATIDNFFHNGAHDVYELQMNDGRVVLIPDVEAFVVETNISERFIRVVDLDRFFF